MKYVGMDAHSRTSTFVVLGMSGSALRQARVALTEKELLGFVRSVKGEKKLAFEEGVMSHWLYLLLKDEVDELVVYRLGPMEGLVAVCLSVFFLKRE